jgi:hypothetical protein
MPGQGQSSTRVDGLPYDTAWLMLSRGGEGAEPLPAGQGKSPTRVGTQHTLVPCYTAQGVPCCLAAPCPVKPRTGPHRACQGRAGAPHAWVADAEQWRKGTEPLPRPGLVMPCPGWSPTDVDPCLWPYTAAQQMLSCRGSRVSPLLGPALLGPELHTRGRSAAQQLLSS